MLSPHCLHISDIVVSGTLVAPFELFLIVVKYLRWRRTLLALGRSCLESMRSHAVRRLLAYQVQGQQARCCRVQWLMELMKSLRHIYPLFLRTIAFEHLTRSSLVVAALKMWQCTRSETLMDDV